MYSKYIYYIFVSNKIYIMEKKKIIIELTKETLKKLRELGEAKQRTRKNYIEYILENLAKA